MTLVDLAFNELDVYPEVLEVGEDFFIDYSLYNYSPNSPAGDIQVDFYLSTDSIITNNDYFLGSDYITPGSDLANGATPFFTVNAILPNINNSFWDYSGEYYIGAIAIPSFLDTELNFDNNNAIINGENRNRNSDRIEIDLPLADLTIDRFSLSSKNLVPGNALTVDFSLVNDSDISARDFYVNFYLFEDGKYFWLGDYYVDDIPSYTIFDNLSKNLTLPNLTNSFWTGTGNYDIVMAIDEDDYIIEANENNNLASREIAINILPDLEGRFFNVAPEPLIPGQTVIANFAIANNSSADAGAFWVNFYLSKDNNITTSDRYLNSYNISGINDNTLISDLTKTLTLPDSHDPFWYGSKTYYLGMIIDADNTVNEYHESNNSNLDLITDHDDIIVSLNRRQPSANSHVNIPIYRFQNTKKPGSYIFVGEAERHNIRQNFTHFQEEGFAFSVGIAPGDDLMPLYRFQNKDRPGTYIFVGEAERHNINNSQYAKEFQEEGLAFYVYKANYELGTVFYRLQNTDLPGTYIYASPEEKDNILANFGNFINEGEAFGVEIY